MGVVVLVVVLVLGDALDEGLMIHLLGLVVLVVVGDGGVRTVGVDLQLGEAARVQHGGLSGAAAVDAGLAIHLCLLIL